MWWRRLLSSWQQSRAYRKGKGRSKEAEKVPARRRMGVGGLNRTAGVVLQAILEEDLPHIHLKAIENESKGLVKVYARVPRGDWEELTEMDSEAILAAKWGNWRFRTACIVGIKLRYYVVCHADN